MSYEDGMAALNLEFPGRVPRTEYSAECHWPLVSRVTGRQVDQHSAPEVQSAASRAFMRAWQYDFYWSVLTNRSIFGEKATKMGHAVYESGGGDYSGDVSRAFDDVGDVYRIDFDALYGVPDGAQLTAAYNRHLLSQRPLERDMVTMTGVYVTCVSGLIELFGWEMLLEALGEDPEAFGQVTNRYCRWIQRYFDALANCDGPVVMVHDDIVWTEGPFVRPDWYRAFVLPNYKTLFAPLREAGKKILFTSDGNYTQFVDDIAPYVDGFVMEPCTDLRAVAEKYGRTHVLVGNADTRILLSGTREDIRNEVKRCMDIGKQCPGFFMAVGNHIPANTPVENALWYNECYEALSRR